MSNYKIDDTFVILKTKYKRNIRYDFDSTQGRCMPNYKIDDIFVTLQNKI